MVSFLLFVLDEGALDIGSADCRGEEILNVGLLGPASLVGFNRPRLLSR